MFDADLSRRVRLLGLDVDGVLTDNGTWLGEQSGAPVEFKRFDIQDGLGLRLLRGSGIDVFWLTGRASPATTWRARELRVDTVLTVEPFAKVPALEALLRERGVDWDAVAFVGDDIADLPVLERVGLPIAVANARDEIKRVARHVTAAAGGHGAVREVIEALLRSRGEFDLALARFFATSGSR